MNPEKARDNYLRAFDEGLRQLEQMCSVLKFDKFEGVSGENCGMSGGNCPYYLGYGLYRVYLGKPCEHCIGLSKARKSEDGGKFVVVGLDSFRKEDRATVAQLIEELKGLLVKVYH